MDTIIRYFKDKINSLGDTLVRQDIFVVIILFCVAIISFALGYFARGDKSERVPIVASKAFCVNPITEETTKNTARLAQGTSTIVASKSGSRYYFVWCSGATRISEKNKVYFSSKEDAEKKGYTLASGCK